MQSASTIWKFTRLHFISDTITAPLHITSNKSGITHSNSPPMAPPGKLNETYTSSLILAYLLHYLKTWCHPQKLEIHNPLQCCQIRTRPRSQVTCTENLEKFDMRCFRYVSGHTHSFTPSLKPLLQILPSLDSFLPSGLPHELLSKLFF